MKRNNKKETFKAVIIKSLLLSLSLLFIFSGAQASVSPKKVKYNYILHVPDNYDNYPDKKWPVIFYLHGRHASGTNLQSVKRYGLPYFLSKGKKMDFVVVAPQCPWGKNWTTDDWFNPVYDEVASKLNIDDTRVYLIGISMGGFGTWALANRMPDRFAAISPMCGGANKQWAGQLSKIPTWVFHGTADQQIPISRSEVMVKELERLNANVKFTKLKNEGHDISKQFNNDELYQWLMQHSLKKIPFWEEPLPFLKNINATKVVANPPLISQEIANTR